MSPEKFLFIVGLPRSGTKLLRNLLNNHPGISLLRNETDIYPYLLEFFALDRGEEWFEELWGEVKDAKFVLRREADGHPLDPALWKSLCSSASAPDVFAALIKAATPEAGPGVILGDKSPLHVRCVTELMRDFPNARMIHIVRDGREVALSAVDAWSKDPLRAIQQWTNSVMTAHNAGSRHSERFLEVRFEDLKSDPGAVLERACGFLGVSYDSAMAQLKGSAEGLGRAKGQAKVLNLPDRTDDVPPAKLQRMEEVFAPAARQFGYAFKTQITRERVLGPLEMKLRRIGDLRGVAKFHIDQFGWRDGLRYLWKRGNGTRR
ncbi:sulfotransferase [Novosphingobium sp. BW1]|uniref:sulfotransferase family protein n=1 Tax=Novosphingobium sp. BW1 TaxID=2592621 RepID=UPI001396BDF7|nr:sulfotransferase [Novosphingobium sp. BW1]